jgi:hypothetical protein
MVGGALDFFLNEPGAAGAEQLASIIARRRAWLGATAHPRHKQGSLLDAAARVLHERLLIVDDQGAPIDRDALAEAKALALDGVGPAAAPYTFHDYDRDWLWANAGALVRANSVWLERIVQLSSEARADQRQQALRAIAGLGDTHYRALRDAIADTFEDPERSSLLSSIAPSSPSGA